MSSHGIRIIGLTGGIACGKSSVARFFSDRGVPVIDADQLAREAVQPGTPALERIVALFGTRGAGCRRGARPRTSGGDHLC